MLYVELILKQRHLQGGGRRRRWPWAMEAGCNGTGSPTTTLPRKERRQGRHHRPPERTQAKFSPRKLTTNMLSFFILLGTLWSTSMAEGHQRSIIYIMERYVSFLLRLEVPRSAFWSAFFFFLPSVFSAAPPPPPHLSFQKQMLKWYSL